MEIRREVLVYGNLPFAATLPHVDTTTSLVGVLNKLLQEATRPDGQPSCTSLFSLVTLPASHTPTIHPPTLRQGLSSHQALPPSWRSHKPLPRYAHQQATVILLHTPLQVLCDTIEAIAPSGTGALGHAVLLHVCWSATTLPVVRQQGLVDVHAVVLYLFAQLYTRTALRPAAKDVWPATDAGPSTSGGLQLEPSSPVRMSSKGSHGMCHSGAHHELGSIHCFSAVPCLLVCSTSCATRAALPCFAYPAHAGTWPSNFVRQHLQQQQAQQQGIVQGFTEYMQRHAVNLLLLCLDSPPTGHDNLPSQHVQPHEFARLHFLLDASRGATVSCGIVILMQRLGIRCIARLHAYAVV